MPNPNIINLVGWPGAGKSTQGDNLERLGYTLWRPSDAIREFASNNNITIYGREDYIPVRQIMTDDDPDAFTRPVVELLASGVDRICVDGMRVVSNVDELREACGMVTAALVASPETRYKRVLKDAQRAGHRKPRSFEAFIADEQADSSRDPNLPNTQAVMNQADWPINAELPANEVLQDLQLRLCREGILKQLTC